jgi:ABC-2 type transport system permease protein
MKKILIIAGKELLSTLRQRNLILIMFLLPIVLSTIIGLAFGGLGGASGTPDFADISVAVVNLDTGFNLQQQLPTTATSSSLLDSELHNLELEIGSETVNLGDALNPGHVSLNYGDQLAAILLSQPLTATPGVVGNGGFDLSELSCPLLPADEDGGTAFASSPNELLDTEVVHDPALAREGVMRGAYDVAVIIPPNFSQQLAPSFGISATDLLTPTGTVEVFANNGTPISASIVRAVVEGIVNEFTRINVSLSALVLTTINTVNGFDVNALTGMLQGIDASALEPLGCLVTPGASNVQIVQQPLDEVQTRSAFGVLMVVLGGSQAVFFALFTGIFGINSIYEDRIQGTLQRLLVTPTPSSSILAGRLLGNLVIVITQLLTLLFALALITMLVEQDLTFIWGDNLVALLLVVVGLGLFTTGLGVLIVGLASSSEQVQLIGPLITLLLGALSGTFGFMLPRQVTQLSPIWWGVDAIRKLAANESDIGLHLLVLFAVGILFASVGTFFFRRRMDL